MLGLVDVLIFFKKMTTVSTFLEIAIWQTSAASSRCFWEISFRWRRRRKIDDWFNIWNFGESNTGIFFSPPIKFGYFFFYKDKWNCGEVEKSFNWFTSFVNLVYAGTYVNSLTSLLSVLFDIYTADTV